MTPDSNTTISNTALDHAAIGISLLCVIHCLTLPIALTLIPSIGGLPLADERFHLWLVMLVVPTSFIALFLGCRRHRRWHVVGWGVAGVTALVLTAVFGHSMLGEVGERVFTVIGAVLVAIGHVLNYRLCRQVDCCD